MKQMQQQMQAMEQELKKVRGDLQTAQREEVHAKKRLEVEKFSGDLDKVSNRADMATTLYKARLNDAKQQLMNSNVSEADVEELDVFEPMVEDLES
jgi:TolA-binding protein